jgi:hypothetical protein
MNRIDGKKYREIAELLDISRKQLRKEMAALKILKEQIENIYSLIYSRVNRIEIVLYIELKMKTKKK